MKFDTIEVTNYNTYEDYLDMTLRRLANSSFYGYNTVTSRAGLTYLRLPLDLPEQELIPIIESNYRLGNYRTALFLWHAKGVRIYNYLDTIYAVQRLTDRGDDNISIIQPSYKEWDAIANIPDHMDDVISQTLRIWKAVKTTNQALMNKPLGGKEIITKYIDLL